jgi:hypothetical protein
MAVRESQLEGEVHVNHIEGKLNPSDLLTKEHKNGETFVQLCNLLVVPCRSDGGCRIPASRILSPDLSPDLNRRTDVKDDRTKEVESEASEHQEEQTNQQRSVSIIINNQNLHHARQHAQIVCGNSLKTAFNKHIAQMTHGRSDHW